MSSHQSISYPEVSIKGAAAWTSQDCDDVEELFRKLANKHSLHALSILALQGEQSFGDLLRAMKPIAPKVLTECLTQLQDDEFVHNRRVLEGKVKRSYYSIVKKEKFIQILVGFRGFVK